jgi:hypothetical protein
MKGLFLAAAFVSSSIISFSPSIAQSAEPDELICKHEMKEIVVTKQQCTQLHTVLKDIEIEFDRIIASKKLSLESVTLSMRDNTWYYSRNYGSNNEGYTGLVSYRNHSGGGTINPSVGKDNKAFSAGYSSGESGLGIQLALTSHEIPIFDKPPFIEPTSSEYFPKGSIRIRGNVDSIPANALIYLQKMLDELKKL